MDGKTVLITGSTAGIGKQAAIGLLQQGAHVVLVGRNPEKTKAVADELKTRTANPKVEYLLADLSSVAEVRRLAGEFMAKHPRLDVLLNNAGGMFPNRENTAEGFERTMATNHLAYHVLANALLPVLEKSAPARIVNVSSGGHVGGKLKLDDMFAEKSYNNWIQYCRSKAANVYFTKELARRLKDKQITVNCLHPGFVASDFLAKPGFWNFIKPLAYVFAINEVDGAKTSVYLCSSPEVEGVTGQYFIKCRARPAAKWTDDEAIAKQLWDWTEAQAAKVGAAKAA